MILPTRSRSLNRHIEEFNRGLLDLSFNIKNVSIIDNSIFGHVLSDEHGRWNSHEQKPLTSDIVHLGKKGIRMLAMNIKTSVLNKKKSRSRTRFNAGGGSYGSALGRTNHIDGYNPF